MCIRARIDFPSPNAHNIGLVEPPTRKRETVRREAIEGAIIEGAVHRLRPKRMTVSVVLASLVPILWESGIGSDIVKLIAARPCGRHDHFDHPRVDCRACVLCTDEGKCASPRNPPTTGKRD